MVLVLGIWDPDVDENTYFCSILTVLCDEVSARDFLGVLWQVEAAALALTVAATLFAFESVVRQRASLSLRDYAQRTGLMQFVMLGSSGLIVVGIVLAWWPGHPPIAGAAFALLVAGLGIAAFPLFLRRAIDVVGPGWFRHARLKDISKAVEEHVRNEAIVLTSLVELDRWVEEHPGSQRILWAPDPHTALEVAPAAGSVFDLDLDRLTKVLPTAEGLFVSARIGARLTPNATVIGVTGDAGPPPRSPIVTLVRPTPLDILGTQVTVLHEEALEAVRSGSPSAMEEVAEGYVQMLLAWPRAWGDLGQRVQGGLLSASHPFGIGPVDQIQRHLWLQLEQAVERGLREHVLTITSILWTVGREAIDLRADDLIRKVNELARIFVSASKGTNDLERLVADRCWRYHVEVCEFQAARRLREEQVSLEESQYWADVVDMFFSSISELLRTLYDRSLHQDFDALDRRFRKLLESWKPVSQPYLVEALIEDPSRFDATPSEVADAKRDLATMGLKEQLERKRTGYRLSVLAWMLHRVQRQGSEAAWDRIIAYAQSLLKVDHLIESVGYALGSDGPLDRWVGAEGPELEARFIDVEGPVLRAVVLVLLLKQRSLKRIPPAAWMSEHRLKRAVSVIAELVEGPQVREVALGPDDDAEDVKTRVREVLERAHAEQRELEDRFLAQRDLDQEKVTSFKEAIVQGWSENRLAPQLLRLTNAELRLLPREAFGDGRFGFTPQLEPKGLFVTPTNWGGLEDHGMHLGTELARGEADAIIQELVAKARPIEGTGSAVDRLKMLLQTLREEGYTLSLVLMPIDWRLERALELPERAEPEAEDGPLGHHLRGWFDHIPVMEWSGVPEDRLIVTDLAAFCDVTEAGVEGTDEAEPPTVVLESIDEARADEIISSWEPLDTESEEAARRRRVLTSVRLDIHRRYQVSVLDEEAVRSVWLPRSARRD